MKKNVIVSILICFVFLSCKNTNNSFHNYIIYSQKIAEIMDEKIRNIDNLDISPYFINDELKTELVKQDYKKPSKETILIYKYSVNGPLPYYFEEENKLPDVLQIEIHISFVVQHIIYLTLQNINFRRYRQ